MNIVFPDYIDLTEEARSVLKTKDVTLYDDTPDNEQTIIERIKDAEIITASYIDITPKVIDNAPKLRYIIVPAKGHEWVDTGYAAQKGIKVLNCPTHNFSAVAEHAITLMLALGRNIFPAAASLKAGEWQPQGFQGIEVRDKKLALLGYGLIGKRIEEIATALGMHVSHANSSTTSEAVDAMLQEADVVCMALPLTDKTKHFMDGRRLNLLQPHTLLINVGRGATVDQGELLVALKNKKLAGAGLDVYDGEPLTGTPSPEIVEIANLPNVLATPHMAYHTKETAVRLGEEILKNLEDCLANKPVNVVN